MVVIGCGADGGVLTQRLARAGWRAVAMDAGLFTDGSTLPTQGAANPALTIMALVARAADAMIRRAGKVS